MLEKKKVEMLALGDELLLGLRENAHLAWVGAQLAGYGLPICRSAEIRDHPGDILEVFRGCWERADLVITTGGLGPTSDDLTREAMAAALGRGLRYDMEVEKALRDRFSHRGLVPGESNFRQCMILEGAEVLPNPNGSAPGQWLEENGKILVMLPGPAHEMRPMFLNEVLPRLIARGWAIESSGYLLLRTMGLGESVVAESLQEIFDEFGDKLNVAYCAHNGLVDVRLASFTEQLSRQELEVIGGRCQERLGKAFVGYGEVNVPCLILKLLHKMGKSLAVAESCTGGLLASRFAEIPGASKVFYGGIVSYRTEAKEVLLDVPGCLLRQHGAVSAECAVAMAMGAAEKFEADYAISITGYAGPEGGREPVGTVYIGFHSPIGVWSRKVTLAGTRTQIQQRAVNCALDMIRYKLMQCELMDLIESIRC